MERIIGIDIGLRNTGYGILDFGQNTEKIIEGGVIKTDSKENLHISLQAVFLSNSALESRKFANSE